MGSILMQTDINLIFDLEFDGYFLPNATRLNQFENFNEQRIETGLIWKEFFDNNLHEHHFVMDRSGKNPNKTFQIFYTRPLKDSLLMYLNKINKTHYTYENNFNVYLKNINDLKKEENNYYIINLFGSEDFLFSSVGPEVLNLKENFNQTNILQLNPIVLDKIQNENLKLVIVTFHEGGVLYENFYKKLYNTINVFKLNANNIYYFNANASNVELHDIWCNKNNIKNKINAYFTDWLLSMSLQNYSSKPFFNDVSINNREYNFLYLNRSVFKEHRIWVLGELYKRGVLNNSLYSIIFPYKNDFTFRNDNITGFGTFTTKENYTNTLPYMEEIKNKGIVKIDDFPTTKRFNYDDIDPFAESVIPAYNNTYFSIVTESTFNVTQISEKIAKPLVYKHPFIVVSGPKYLQALRDIGFKTFDKYFDESYDDEFDDIKRMNKILNLIEELNDREKLKQIYIDAHVEIEHNSKLANNIKVKESIKRFLINLSNENNKSNI